ncbi:MAG TPA: PD-(D/E)XK nuclease family protein, partial [Flavobacterium sp.]|nr:PD-(D/E)XK nuclease family protein [Flavobacterium sp.]
MIEKNIEHLLYNVAIIEKKYDDLAEITGEHYNIFDILGKRSDELSHSSILSNLLNTKGKHGQKDLFLKLFIEIIKNGFITDEKKVQFFKDFKTETSKAETEKFTGKVDYIAEQGGRIDILVNNGNSNLIIENKVYAGDQPLQLVRYNEFDKNAPILYLTLDGKEPKDISKGNLKKGIDYCCISYQVEIANWIEQCIEKTANKPIIRETLNQYLNLIKSLTNQSTNNNMSEEIKDLIKRDFKSANEIVKNYEIAKNDICNNVRDTIKSILELEIGSKYSITYANSQVSDKNSKIFLELKNHTGLNIFFGVEPFSGKGGIGSELFLGILDIEQKNKLVFEKYDDFKKGWWVNTEKFN